MKVTVVPPSELGAEEVLRWRQLRQTAGLLDSPFLDPEFAFAVSEQRPSARVAVIEDTDGPVGFLPFERHRGGVAHPIGRMLSDYQAVIFDGEAGIDIKRILREADVRIWEFDHLAGEQRWMFEGQLASIRGPLASPVIDVRRGFDSYVEDIRRRSKSYLSNTARKRRRLERERGPCRLIIDSRNHFELDQLLEWKSDQYLRTGRRDRFAMPGNRELVHRLLDTSHSHFGGGLAVLYAGEAVAASLFYVQSASLLSYWFPAYNPEFEGYSPGLILLLQLTKALADAGPTRIDLGKGSEAYKAQVSNWAYPVLEGWTTHSRSVAVSRAVYRWPRDQAYAFVLGSETLRRHARRILAGLGSSRRWVRGLRT